ncbi:MAG: ABC transporter permease, partial [Bacteroidota bacterium]
MLIKIAWRNIWRNKTRSLVVIGAVVIGIWALTFLLGFVRGIVQSYLSRGIENETSHVQIHHPDYIKERASKHIIQNTSDILQALDKDPEVEQYCSRILLNGMIASSKTKRGVILKGIDPEKEKLISRLDLKLVDGNFFEGKGKNQILISENVAEKMNLKIRSKLVFTFQDVNGEINSAAFRVAGIYKLGNIKLDQFFAFAKKSDLERLANISDGAAHEIAILLADVNKTIDTYPDKLNNTHSNVLAQNYKTLSPDLELLNSQIQLNLIIMTTIVMLALIFGIINTMLMAVLERIKELGMLMAIGMNKTKV